MIKLEKTEVFGWEAAIRGMRNPMNSWDRSDSRYCGGFDMGEECPYHSEDGCRRYNKECVGLTPLVIGPNDHDLMMQLAEGGSVHAKYRRMITVYVDITAPLYWWKEFDTYKVGTVANSCSTMHKIADKKFTLDDFSHEHLIVASLNCLKKTIEALNMCREGYLSEDVSKNPEWKKEVWWQMIQLLPSSYNQKRTVMLNYEVLAGIYEYRRDHKLDEWREFCGWIKELPYSKIITGVREDKNNE